MVETYQKGRRADDSSAVQTGQTGGKLVLNAEGQSQKQTISMKSQGKAQNEKTRRNLVHNHDSENFQKKEEKVRSAAQHVMKFDLEKENIIEPMVLPKADAIISALLLDMISKEKEDYVKYLRRFSKLLKPGGHFILIGDLETTYYTVGKDKLHAMNYDEDFVRKGLDEAGFVIDRCEVKERAAVSDLTDYKHVMFIVAHKKM
ncbi:unnamed protein product [Ranitomeya imitator]|uniref:Methyltransferase type 11 domain-containing protein n=1 Tax=Ranitomeya imitator TaxID=111125 RepID=A0ABN9L4D4_9NEOB|nr:unnamed protein product [Ranitomeya imitator]